MSRSALEAATRDVMFALLREHFDGVEREQFDHDLDEKNWVVLIERGSVLLGFSTLLAYEATVDGETLAVVCSGDTIVSPLAWGSAKLPRLWIHSVYELRRSLPNGRLIWLLLTSGFRTYRFLPVFWQRFFPRFDLATPPAWQSLLDRLASERYGEAFYAATGVVRFANPQQLRPALARIPTERLADPHVRFFVERNPGHARGDELVCIADLDPSQLTPAGRRVLDGAGR